MGGKMKRKIAINGFGRIGRLLVKAWYLYHKNTFDITAINAAGSTGVLSPEHVAHFIQFDSNYGKFNGKINLKDNKDNSIIIIDEMPIVILGENDPQKLPWEKLGINIVLESSGKFLNKEKVAPHLAAGAKMVIMTAPPKDDTKMIILGFNDEQIHIKNDKIISMASCTSNAIAIPINLLHQKFGVLGYNLCTTHAFTND